MLCAKQTDLDQATAFKCPPCDNKSRPVLQPPANRRPLFSVASNYTGTRGPGNRQITLLLTAEASSRTGGSHLQAYKVPDRLLCATSKNCGFDIRALTGSAQAVKGPQASASSCGGARASHVDSAVLLIEMLAASHENLSRHLKLQFLTCIAELRN